MSFENAWREAEQIRGWLNKDEGRHLFEAACQVSGDQFIIEVGAYRGRSSCLMAESGRTVITVDPMKQGENEANRMGVCEEDIVQLSSVVERYQNLVWVRKSSQECPLPNAPIGLLYIDGDHQFPHPRNDYEHFRPALADGALVAFHDYGEFAAVTETVDHLCQEHELRDGSRVGSMYIGRYARRVDAIESDEAARPTEVTGFHLFVLCHRFGRRGRAFARSLATQTAPPNLHLTVFYCEHVDAAMILDGANAGTSLHALTLERVPAERIMQRALHFASAQYDERCSHVVFLDCDLWFPRRFWAEYAEVLRREPMGYWSTWMTEIPCEDAEELIERWRDICEEDLARKFHKPRHKGFNGMVGHFQCVPKHLLRYPQDDIQAVNRADETFSHMAVKLSQDRRKDRRIGTVPLYHFDHPHCWTGTTEQL